MNQNYNNGNQNGQNYNPNGQNYNYGQYQGGMQPPPINQMPLDNMMHIQRGRTAQTQGIVGLIIGLICCNIAGIVLGILAMSNAKSSRMGLGYETPEAKTGHICGLIALIISILTLIGGIFTAATNYFIISDYIDEIVGTAVSMFIL